MRTLTIRTPCSSWLLCALLGSTTSLGPVPLLLASAPSTPVEAVAQGPATVTDPLSRPVTNAEVRVLYRRGTDLVLVASSATDQAGHFVLPVGWLSQEGEVEIRKAGFSQTTRTLATLKDDPVIYWVQDAALVPWQALQTMAPGDLETAVLGFVRHNAVFRWTYLTNLLSWDDVLRPAFLKATTNADERVVIGAANFLCTIGEPQDIESLLAVEHPVLKGPLGAPLADMLASALPAPFSEKSWQHLAACLGHRYGRGAAFRTAVQTLVLKGSARDKSRAEETLTVLSRRGGLNREDRRYVERAISLIGKPYPELPSGDAATVAEQFLERLGLLYRTTPGKMCVTLDAKKSKALVSFSTGGQNAGLYRMCLHKAVGRWTLASLHQWGTAYTESQNK